MAEQSKRLLVKASAYSPPPLYSAGQLSSGLNTDTDVCYEWGEARKRNKALGERIARIETAPKDGSDGTAMVDGGGSIRSGRKDSRGPTCYENWG